MKHLLLAAILAVLAWQAYSYFRGSADSQDAATSNLTSDDWSEAISTKPQAKFSCDGRTRCSQMTSCAEAEYFLQNCPGVEMDGNNDGEPCESQWCGNSH